MKAPALALSAILLTSIGGIYVVNDPLPQPTVIVEVQQEPALSPLERARRAVCDIDMPNIGGGSAVLVGRIKTEHGYRYRAVTAFHVPDGYRDALARDPNLKNEVTLTFQPDFHGDPLVIKVEPTLMDWALPSFDWTSFTFESELKLECAPVATKAKFEKILPFETIYIVGCGGPYGATARTGTIAATHNIGIRPDLQAKAKLPWHQNPRRYFKLSTPIWYGDSGGSVFNKEGKLIGIINGYSISTQFGEPVTHSGVCLKMHVIRDIIDPAAPNFFKVEN